MQVTITPEEIRKEIERILKERFGVENIGWDDNGSAVVDTELDKILREQKKPTPQPWITQPNPYTPTPLPFIQPYPNPRPYTFGGGTITTNAPQGMSTTNGSLSGFLTNKKELK